ncbi:MAG: macro domain-containing protein, partial [Eubacteriales bacterium]|nr:macro domain-containing protein [Eubacteriales bacterium]
GNSGEERKLRSCYRKSLDLAWKQGLKSIAFPLISTGSFGYPKEEGMRIAVDEINAFLMKHPMLVYLVVFDQKATDLGHNLFPDLQSYIDENYVESQKDQGIFNAGAYHSSLSNERTPTYYGEESQIERKKGSLKESRKISFGNIWNKATIFREEERYGAPAAPKEDPYTPEDVNLEQCQAMDFDFEESHGHALEERMSHISDTFSEYLIYLIDSRGLSYPDVYKRAIIDKKAFSKIKNNPNAHPKKITAMCLCIGAKLNMDQTKDLLARAGYALSPCDKTDIIFSYFIENEIYDMIELDIQLEEHGLPCLIS